MFAQIVSAVALTLLGGTPAQDISVTVNGEPVSFAGTGPMMVDSRVLIPLRGVFEKLGATVQWRDADQSVQAKKCFITILLKIGSTTAVANDLDMHLDVPPMVIQGRTLVPIRFVSETLGAKVTWDEKSHQVQISTRG